MWAPPEGGPAGAGLWKVTAVPATGSLLSPTATLVTTSVRTCLDRRWCTLHRSWKEPVAAVRMALEIPMRTFDAASACEPPHATRPDAMWLGEWLDRERPRPSTPALISVVSN